MTAVQRRVKSELIPAFLLKDTHIFLLCNEEQNES